MLYYLILGNVIQVRGKTALVMMMSQVFKSYKHGEINVCRIKNQLKDIKLYMLISVLQGI